MPDNVIEFKSSKSKQLEELFNTAQTLEEIYKELDNMYKLLNQAEQKAGMAESYYNTLVEDFESQGYELDEYLQQFYTGAKIDAKGIVSVLSLSRDDFNSLIEHPDFPGIMTRPDEVREWLKDKEEDDECED